MIDNLTTYYRENKIIRRCKALTTIQQLLDQKIVIDKRPNPRMRKKMKSNLLVIPTK